MAQPVLTQVDPVVSRWIDVREDDPDRELKKLLGRGEQSWAYTLHVATRRFQVYEDPASGVWKEQDTTNPHYDLWGDDFLGLVLGNAFPASLIKGAICGVFDKNSPVEAWAEGVIARSNKQQEQFFNYRAQLSELDRKEGGDYRAHLRKAKSLEAVGQKGEAAKEYVEAALWAPTRRKAAEYLAMATALSTPSQDDIEDKRLERAAKRKEWQDTISGVDMQHELEKLRAQYGVGVQPQRSWGQRGGGYVMPPGVLPQQPLLGAVDPEARRIAREGRRMAGTLYALQSAVPRSAHDDIDVNGG